MIGLLEAGIDPCSPDISSELAGPGFEATALYMEASESIFCLQFQYEAFGPLVQQDPTTRQVLDAAHSLDVVFSRDTTPYRFTGKPVSTTTGLYYEYQRWYDPSIGRFISQDPLPGHARNPQSLNPYVYVVNQPTLLTDPTGADATWDGLCGGDRCEGWGSTYGSVSSVTVSLNDVQVSSLDVSEIPTSFEVDTAQFSDASLSSTYNFDETPAGLGGAEPVLKGNSFQARFLFEDFIEKGVDPSKIGTEEAARSATTGKMVKFDVTAPGEVAEVKYGYVSGSDAKAQIVNQFSAAQERGLNYRYVVYGRISGPVKEFLSGFGIVPEERVP